MESCIMKDDALLEKTINTHPSIRELFKIFNDINEAFGMRFFLVGGFVRDILLGIESVDIDIAVEGDLEKVIEFVNERIDTDYVYYERFQTATLTLEEFKVDLITCRKESYNTDGALPDIIPGTFEDDIWRRDFTVNAMAIEISSSDQFRLIGPKQAKSDLKTGLIRILHERSFYEDPTRLFRAIRYMCRLGFDMEARTKIKFIEAIEDGALTYISTNRIYNEMCRDLKEPVAFRILEAYKEWQLDRFMFPEIELNVSMEKNLKELESFELKFIEDTESFEPCELRLLVIFYYNYKRANQFIEKFHLSKRFANMLVSMKKLIEKMSHTDRHIKKSEIFKLFEDVQDEVLLTLYLCVEDHWSKNIIKQYYRSLKDMVNPVRGSDLLKIGVQPGPQIRELLDTIMVEYLDGRVNNKAEALEYAESLIKY